ncbi:MAG: CvpA family protein [Acidobacteria bacterium]|nr:CvpA family protein [Acidobacteriota bacterium]
MKTVAAWNWFDWLLVGILVYSTVAAFVRGFFREVFSLVGIVAGILLASWNYRLAAAELIRLLGGHISTAVADVIGFLAIALIVMVGCGLVGKVLAKTAKTVGLGFLDRLLGAAFGFARGCLLGVAVMMAAAAFVPGEAYLSDSPLSSCFLAGAHAVSFVVPANLEKQIRLGVVAIRARTFSTIRRVDQLPRKRIEN